jgi:integrase
MPTEKRPSSAPKHQRLVIAGRFALRAPFWHQTSYCVRIRDLRTGKMFKFCTGKGSKAAATRAAVQFAEEQARDVPTVVSISIAKAAEEWLSTRRLRPSATRDYKGMLGQMTGNVHELTPQAFEKVLAKRPAARTRKKYIVCTRAFYRWAIRRGYAAEDPTADAKAGKIEEKERPSLSVEQAQAFLIACRNPDKRRFGYRNRKPGEDQQAQSKRTLERLWRAVLLGFYTGLRLGNIVTLRWPDIDLAARFIRIPGDRSKSGRVIAVPLKKELAALMVAWPREDGPVIGPAVEDLGKSFDSAVRRASEGFPRVTFHSTRHTFASWALRATKNLALVAELLGHSRKAATVSHRYVHFEPEDLLAAVDALPWIATSPEPPKEGSAPAARAGGKGTRPGA